MDRHKSVVSRIFLDPDDGSKLSERGEFLGDESKLSERGELPTDFHGTVAFYQDTDGRVGYEVYPKDEQPFVELGFATLRAAEIHFMRFRSKPESTGDN